jgi:hypothetical protein
MAIEELLYITGAFFMLSNLGSACANRYIYILYSI